MEVKDFRCNTCDTVGNWENVDQYRHAAKDMHICKTCGAVGYPTLYKTEEEIKEYYRKEYRPAPNVGNLYSGQRKLAYHQFFLDEYFAKWQKEGKEDLVIGETGSAYGMVLSWIKRAVFPKADINGTELTLAYRRVAHHEFGIELKEDFDFTKKYDLLMSYKVHEHIIDTDKHLRKMVECMHEGSLFYFSVPAWFEQAYNFGSTNFDLEYYYSTNHIQVLTRKLWETMLKKVGLEIVKQDHIIYDSTYMCKRNDELMKEAPVYEDYKEIKDRMDKMKRASEAFDNKDYKGAIDIWPNYPTAWQGYYEGARAEWHKKGFKGIVEEFVKPMLKACPNSSLPMGIYADICMRYNEFGLAIDTLENMLKARPECPSAILNMSHCFRQLAIKETDHSKKYEMLKQARDITRHLKSVSVQHFAEATNWMYKDQADLPMPSELQEGK